MFLKLIDKEKKFWFFKKTFVQANFSKKIELRILFLILSNIKKILLELEFFSRTYSFIDIILTTK